MDHKKTIPAESSKRRTRHDPPALDEAITAAQGLTDQIESQIEIAAQLIGLPEDEVMPQVLLARAHARNSRVVPARSRQTEITVIRRRGPRVQRS